MEKHIHVSLGVFSWWEVEHCYCFSSTVITPPCFLLPVCCVLKFCVIRKEIILKTVAETKPWHNQQVLGVSLPVAKEFVFLQDSVMLCLCSQHNQGTGAIALPHHPSPSAASTR